MALDPNLNLVYDKPKTNYLMPQHLRENRLAPEEASQLLAGMRAVAPHGALDKTRLDWHGLQIQGYGSRVHDNERITRLGRWLHQLDGDEFESAHPDKTQGFGDAFLPYANLVTVPSGMGGTAMHELGHAIDFNSFPADSSFRHGLAALYRNHAPTLWKEHAAWSKGRKHVLDAYAQDKLDPKVTFKTLESGKGAKRVGLGSYWGATLGGLGGVGAGLASLIAAHEAGLDTQGLGRLATIPILLGGSLGAMGGIGLGNYLAKNPPKREKIVHMMAKSLARKHGIRYSEAQQLVEKQLAQTTSPSTGKNPAMRKAASSLVDPAFIAPLAGAAVGGGIGALSSSKNKLRNALIGAGIGGGAGGAAEYALPGLGLGGKFTAEDIATYLKSKAVGQPGMLETLNNAAHRVGEMGEYAMRRHSTLPGLELAYLPGHFKGGSAVEFGAKMAESDDGKNERKRRAKNRAEDLVPMKGFGRGYADYLLPSTFGGTRAGRATMVAKALGQKPDFSVSNPVSDSALSSLGGGALGAIPGAALGGLLGALSGNPNNAAAGAMLGGGLGGTAGSILGVAGSGMTRREHMQKIQEDLAKELEQHGTSRLNLETPQYGLVSSLLMPLSGAHRAGQADAYEALKNNTRYGKTPGRTAGYLAAHLPYVGPLVNAGQGIGQNLSARKRLKQEQATQPLEDQYGLEEFGAPKFANARAFGEKIAEVAGMSDREGLLAGATGLGARYGGLAGAALGGVHGLLSPGEVDDEDENGNPIKRKRNRLLGALRGAGAGLGLGLVGGGAAGGLTEKFHPGFLNAVEPTSARMVLDRAANSRREMPSYNVDLPAAQVAQSGGMA